MTLFVLTEAASKHVSPHRHVERIVLLYLVQWQFFSSAAHAGLLRFQAWHAICQRMILKGRRAALIQEEMKEHLNASARHETA